MPFKYHIFIGIIFILTVKNANSQINLENGLLAYYPFNGNTNDESGNDNHGTGINVILASDRFGTADKAYDFNGSNAYVAITSTDSLESPTTELTMAAWFYANLNSSFTPILMKSESTSNAFQYRMYVANNRIGTSLNNWNNSVVNDVAISSNKWHLIVSTLKNGAITGFLDGILIDTNTIAIATIALDTHDLEIGRDVPGLTEYFKGKIDDVRIYSRAINAEEVMALYNEGNYQELFKDSFEDSIE